jgi:NADH-quinone oxidoreductase subunit C
MFSEEVKATRVAQALGALEDAVLDGGIARGELTLVVAADRITEVARFLKQDGFVRLSAVTCVDLYPMEPRFEVVYQLHSLSRSERVRLKCKVSGAAPEIDSVTGIWRCANWYEREVFDMFGIVFRGHPDLTRILMPDDWNGHPLRKDYPVHGHKYSYQNE